jgi:DNA-binding protein YbaB
MSTPIWGDPDSVLATVEDQIRQAEAHAAKARELEANMRTITGRATSKDRAVTAAVSASGLVTELTLTQDALELHERDLARSIQDTVNAAHRSVGEQAVALSAEAFGAESDVTQRLRDEASAREQLPTDPDITY